ncbi:MAG: hypothetical protein AB7U41_07955 [Dongiaceae bacterium]
MVTQKRPFLLLTAAFLLALWLVFDRLALPLVNANLRPLFQETKLTQELKSIEANQAEIASRYRQLGAENFVGRRQLENQLRQELQNLAGVTRVEVTSNEGQILGPLAQGAIAVDLSFRHDQAAQEALLTLPRLGLAWQEFHLAADAVSREITLKGRLQFLARAEG